MRVVRNSLMLSAILGAALGLSACGGGGGSTPVGPKPIPNPDTPEGAVLGDITSTCVNDTCTISKLGWKFAQSGRTGETIMYSIAKDGVTANLPSGTINATTLTSGDLISSSLTGLSKNSTYTLNLITKSGSTVVNNNTFVLIHANNG